MALHLPFLYPQCIALRAATYGRAAGLAFALEGLGLGVPLSPGSGWQVQALKVVRSAPSSHLSRPNGPLFLSEPAVLPASAELTHSSFLLWLWEVSLPMAPFREDSAPGSPWMALPVWVLPLEPGTTTRQPPAGPGLSGWYPLRATSPAAASCLMPISVKGTWVPSTVQGDCVSSCLSARTAAPLPPL